MLVPSTRMLRASGNELVGCHTCFAVSSARLELSQLQPKTPTVLSEPHMQGHSHSRIQQWLNRSHLSCVPIWPELSLALQAYSCSRRQPRCTSGCRIYDVTIELLCCHVQQQPWSPLVFSEPLRCPHHQTRPISGRGVLNKQSVLPCRALLSQQWLGTSPPGSSR